MDALPDGYQVRPPVIEDIPQITAMWNRHNIALTGEASHSEAMLQSIFSYPMLDMARDYRLVFDADGQLIASVGVWTREPYVENSIRFRDDPNASTSAIRNYLFKWAHQRAEKQLDEAPDDALVVTSVWTISQDEALQTTLQSLGYEEKRQFIRMVIDVEDAELPAPDFPSGITMASYAERPDMYILHHAVDEAFRDHWGYVEEPLDKIITEWEHWLTTTPHVDYEALWLAMDGDEIAGMSLCLPRLEEDHDMAYVDTLGVRPKWRRQGLGLAMLHYSFQKLQGYGAKRVALDVDADSLTGATRLYERAGMKVERVKHIWEYVLRDGRDYRTQSA